MSKFYLITDGKLSGTTTPGQSEPRRNDNKRVLNIPWSFTSRRFHALSKALVEGKDLTLLQRCSQCIQLPSRLSWFLPGMN